MTTVSVVIPVYGPQSFLDECLGALTWTASEYRLVLVDNGPEPHDFTQAVNLDAVVRNKENLGFAVACNQGAACSRADILVFLNVDTVPQMDWLANLMGAFEDPDVVMAGPRIVHLDGSLQTSGIRTWHGIGSAGGEELKTDQPTGDVDGVTGACMAIRRSVFNELGGMCELYKMGYEDVDLCLTARESGYRIRYVAESAIIHHESATGPERWAHAAENVQLMNQRWGNR